MPETTWVANWLTSAYSIFFRCHEVSFFVLVVLEKRAVTDA